MRLQRLAYNEKGNLTRLLGVAVTTSIIIPAMKEVILVTARRIDQTIIDVTRDQRWYELQIHSVNLVRYERQMGDMELMQAEIEAGTCNIKLAWTLRWLLSPADKENILADPKR